MLLRTYRLTDKISLMLLKTTALASVLVADGVMLLLGQPTGERSGLLGLLAWLLAGLLTILRAIFTVIVSILRAIGAGGLAILAAIQALVSRATPVMSRMTGRTATATRASIGGAMARRAARAEMGATVVEDPLRRQNRILSGLVMVSLAGLIAVVLWATSQNSTGVVAPQFSSSGDGFSVAASQPTEAPESADPPAIIATAIPTATQLPQVLQSRGSMAFTVRENGQTDLWAIRVGTRVPIRITNDPADERDPAWSPDGLQLAYASDRNGNWDLYVYDVTTGTSERKTFGLAFDAAPSWSPDGRWLLYETYQSGNLDVVVLPVPEDSQEPLQPITIDPAADFSPTWSPAAGNAEGRLVAFTSWRDGNQDIYLVSLGDVSTVTNLTNTPNRNEDFAAWHPNGDLIAYSALDGGIEKVFVKSTTELDAPPELIGAGREPAWSPDGSSLVVAVDSIDATHMTVYPYEDLGGTTQVIQVPSQATGPTWTSSSLPQSLINSGGLPLLADPLYLEQEQQFANGLYPLDTIGPGIDAPLANLSSRVNDSFNALREAVLQKSGRDYLARLDETFWDIQQRPQPGEERRNWHYTGRAFALNRSSALVGFPPIIEIVRENRGVNTFWRVFLRVDEEAQFGELGEPLRDLPWDFNTRNTGGDAYEQGGSLKEVIPEGYYVDLTQIAEDYGWTPLPAGSDWRLNFNAINYWAFHKPDGLSWLQAALEIWNREQLGGLAPTLTPPTTEPEA